MTFVFYGLAVTCALMTIGDIVEDRNYVKGAIVTGFIVAVSQVGYLI